MSIVLRPRATTLLAVTMTRLHHTAHCSGLCVESQSCVSSHGPASCKLPPLLWPDEGLSRRPHESRDAPSRGKHACMASCCRRHTKARCGSPMQTLRGSDTEQPAHEKGGTQHPRGWEYMYTYLFMYPNMYTYFFAQWSRVCRTSATVLWQFVCGRPHACHCPALVMRSGHKALRHSVVEHHIARHGIASIAAIRGASLRAGELSVRCAQGRAACMWAHACCLHNI